MLLALFVIQFTPIRIETFPHSSLYFEEAKFSFSGGKILAINFEVGAFLDWYGYL